MKLLIIISFALLLGGCDLFTSRNAEPPNKPRADIQQAVTPDIVIQNLITSLKDKNVEGYISCFSDSSFTNKKFIFSPSSAALSQFPAFAGGWNKKNEEQYFNNMISRVVENLPITLKLSNVSMSPQGDSLIYTASYFLNIPNNDSNISPNYQGDLKFDMIRDSRSIWSIYFWQDSKNSNLPSWSELKGRFY